MKQPDTSALRERLDNYTPEQELEEDMQKLEDLLQEVNCQIVTLRNLLKEINAVKEEEARRQRLEQRNYALANEFRRLKPEIADAHKKLNGLIEGIAAYAGTIQNLHDLLKTSFPIRFAEKDRRALLEDVNAIADNAVSKIRKEREKTENEIRRNDSRVSIPQATFWCMVVLLLLLSMFFAIVLFANTKLLHSGILTEMTVIYSILIAITLTVCTLIFYRQKH